MRKSKTIKIDDREITVKELKVKHVYQLINEFEELSFERITSHWMPKFTDLKPEDIMEFAPSELELVYNAWAEVNASFFKVVDKLGLADVWAAIRRQMLEELSSLFTSSSSSATREPGSTATRSSSR